jgi:phage terminase large subunit-like protein
MMVIDFGSDGRKYVIDFIRDKMKFSEKIKVILEFAERWLPSVIFWEENASVEGGEHIAEALERRGWAIAPRREPKGGGLCRKK